MNLPYQISRHASMLRQQASARKWQMTDAEIRHTAARLVKSGQAWRWPEPQQMNFSF